MPREGYKITELGELPERWDVKKAEDTLILKGGSTPSTNNEKYWNGKIPWVVPTDVTKLKSKFIDNSERRITKDGLLNCSATLLPKGSILLTSRATIGFLAINEVEMATNQGFINILPSKEIFNIFLYYFLDYIKTKFVLQASGSTFLELSKNSFRKFYVPIPPLPEQHRIAAILSTVDETIEHTEALIEKYRNIKKGLMTDLLTRGIDEEGRIRSYGTHRFKDSPLGRIPEEWEVTTLINAIGEENDLIVAGPFGSNLKVDDYIDEGVPIIRLQNIETGKFIMKDIKCISLKKASELSYHSFLKGDIALAKLGEPIGKTCIIPDFMEKGIVVADVVRIRVKEEKSNKKFIMQVLNSFYVFYQLNRDIIGTTRPRVNLGQVRNLLVPYTSLSEQQRIAEILTASDERIEKEEAYVEKLLQLKKGMMQDLLTGRVRVKIPQEEAVA